MNLTKAMSLQVCSAIIAVISSGTIQILRIDMKMYNSNNVFIPK